jgi:NurA-like 5'-3' nuclease
VAKSKDILRDRQHLATSLSDSARVSNKDVLATTGTVSGLRPSKSVRDNDVDRWDISDLSLIDVTQETAILMIMTTSSVQSTAVVACFNGVVDKHKQLDPSRV